MKFSILNKLISFVILLFAIFIFASGCKCNTPVGSITATGSRPSQLPQIDNGVITIRGAGLVSGHKYQIHFIGIPGLPPQNGPVGLADGSGNFEATYIIRCFDGFDKNAGYPDVTITALDTQPSDCPGPETTIMAAYWNCQRL